MVCVVRVHIPRHTPKERVHIVYLSVPMGSLHERVHNIGAKRLCLVAVIGSRIAKAKQLVQQFVIKNLQQVSFFHWFLQAIDQCFHLYSPCVLENVRLDSG